MSNKSNCSMCEKSFNISTLEKYNGVCGRCSKTLIQHSGNEPDHSDDTTESKNDKELSKRTKSSSDSYQKSPIPARLRQEVWEKNIGDKFWGNCFVCNIRLHVMEWSCGHIQSEFKGGKMVFENMKVLCKSCNSKMGTENLLEYKARKYPDVVKEPPKQDEPKKDEPKKQDVVNDDPKKESIFTKCFCL